MPAASIKLGVVVPPLPPSWGPAQFCLSCVSTKVQSGVLLRPPAVLRLSTGSEQRPGGFYAQGARGSLTLQSNSYADPGRPAWFRRLLSVEGGQDGRGSQESYLYSAWSRGQAAPASRRVTALVSPFQLQGLTWSRQAYNELWRFFVF